MDPLVQRIRDLESKLALVEADLRLLREFLHRDSPSTLNKVRYVTESVLHELCVTHGISWGTSEPTLENMIGPLVANKVLPRHIALHVRSIQTNASPGSHYQEEALTPAHVDIAVRALIEFLEWFHGQGRADSVPDVAARRPATRRIAIGLAALVAVAGVLAWTWIGRHKGPSEPAAVAAGVKPPSVIFTNVAEDDSVLSERFNNLLGQKLPATSGPSDRWFAFDTEHFGTHEVQRAKSYAKGRGAHLIVIGSIGCTKGSGDLCPELRTVVVHDDRDSEFLPGMPSLDTSISTKDPGVKANFDTTVTTLASIVGCLRFADDAADYEKGISCFDDLAQRSPDSRVLDSKGVFEYVNARYTDAAESFANAADLCGDNLVCEGQPKVAMLQKEAVARWAGLKTQNDPDIKKAAIERIDAGLAMVEDDRDLLWMKLLFQMSLHHRADARATLEILKQATKDDDSAPAEFIEGASTFILYSLPQQTESAAKNISSVGPGKSPGDTAIKFFEDYLNNDDLWTSRNSVNLVNLNLYYESYDGFLGRFYNSVNAPQAERYTLGITWITNFDAAVSTPGWPNSSEIQILDRTGYERIFTLRRFDWLKDGRLHFGTDLIRGQNHNYRHTVWRTKEGYTWNFVDPGSELCGCRDYSKPGTRHYFDTEGRFTRTETPDGTTICVRRNGVDSTISITDEDGRPFLEAFLDAEGRITETVDFLFRRFSYHYGTQDNLTEVVYPDGRSVQFTHTASRPCDLSSPPVVSTYEYFDDDGTKQSVEADFNFYRPVVLTEARLETIGAHVWDARTVALLNRLKGRAFAGPREVVETLTKAIGADAWERNKNTILSTLCGGRNALYVGTRDNSEGDHRREYRRRFFNTKYVVSVRADGVKEKDAVYNDYPTPNVWKNEPDDFPHYVYYVVYWSVPKRDWASATKYLDLAIHELPARWEAERTLQERLQWMQIDEAKVLVGLVRGEYDRTLSYLDETIANARWAKEPKLELPNLLYLKCLTNILAARPDPVAEEELLKLVHGDFTIGLTEFESELAQYLDTADDLPAGRQEEIKREAARLILLMTRELPPDEFRSSLGDALAYDFWGRYAASLANDWQGRADNRPEFEYDPQEKKDLLAECVSYFEKAVAADERAYQFGLEHGACLANMEKYDDAERVWNEFLKKTDQLTIDAWKAPFYYDVGYYLGAECSQWERAEPYTARAVELDPQSDRYVDRYNRTLRAQDKNEERLPFSKRLLDLALESGDNDRIQSEREVVAYNYFLLNDLPASADAYWKAYQVQQDPYDLSQFAPVELYAGEFRKVQDVLTTELPRVRVNLRDKDMKTLVSLRSSLLQARLMTGDPASLVEDAESVLEDARTLGDDEPREYRMAALSHMVAGNYNAAERWMNAGRAVSADNPLMSLTELIFDELTDRPTKTTVADLFDESHTEWDTYYRYWLEAYCKIVADLIAKHPEKADALAAIDEGIRLVLEREEAKGKAN